MMAPERILISRVDSIGDVMLTLPMLGRLKLKYPKCIIIFLGQAYTRPILERCTHVDQVICWNELREMEREQQINLLNELDCDTAIHVFPNKEVAALVKATKIGRRIGTSHRLYHWWTCNEKVNFTRKGSELHEAQLNMKLLKPLDICEEIELRDVCKLYGFNSGDISKKVSDIHAGKPTIIFHPKSKGSAVEWGLDNFAVLAELMAKKACQILVCGTQAEGEMLKNLCNSQPHLIDCTGNFTLDEYVQLISVSEALVACSTGPLHIAAALGIKTVGLYANMRPIHPGRWGAIGERSINLSANIENKPPTDPSDIFKITPEKAYSALFG